MSNHTQTHVDWIDRTVYDVNGDKLGDVTNSYVASERVVPTG